MRCTSGKVTTAAREVGRHRHTHLEMDTRAHTTLIQKRWLARHNCWTLIKYKRKFARAAQKFVKFGTNTWEFQPFFQFPNFLVGGDPPLPMLKISRGGFRGGQIFLLKLRGGQGLVGGDPPLSPPSRENPGTEPQSEYEMVQCCR